MTEQKRVLVGYDECRCILTQYCDGDCRPVFADRSSARKHTPFQSRVQPWMLECFGPEIAADRIERNHRFFEEATEAVQANGMTRSEAHQLVDYTFDRPVGELRQEIGGVMVTLAALCLASGEDMHAAGETELARIWTKVDQIRAKQAAKPKHSPLPAAPTLSELFYLQDSRSFVGNDVLWWAKDGKGYTTDLRDAHVYTKDEVQQMHDARETDIPWPKGYIDAKTRPAVDMQYIKKTEALAGTEIVLRKQEQTKPYKFNCSGCGRFLNDVDRYCEDCPNCGTDNRP